MSRLLSPKVLIPTAIVILAFVIVNLLQLPGVVLPDISIPAETVFHLFGFPISNTLLSAWLTMLVLILGSWLITRRMKLVPGRWQSALEMIVEGLYGLVENAAGPKWTPKFFPIVTTIFLFVLVGNWLGLTPLFGGWGVLHESHGEEGHPVEWVGDSHSVGIWVRGEEAPLEEGAEAEEHPEIYLLAPMFRAPSTDMNFTLALALVSVALTQYFGVRALGISYFAKFLAVGGIVKAFRAPGMGCGGRIASFFMGIIDIFLGIVETISEIGKVVSFSFRLFGNIFAGEVLLGVMAFLIPFVVSLPFFGLELFVGLVQALVFMMLSVAFFVVATSGHGEEHEEH
ncbi:MAG: F0F1 ATP synthase subunit A [Anaerolineae bacterium]|nr:F0F1 ATP synthase subunit A [Anaerolineae bacterium]